MSESAVAFCRRLKIGYTQEVQQPTTVWAADLHKTLTEFIDADSDVD
jgi:hypothetical protein